MVNGAGNNSQTAYYALGPAADLIGPISDASYDFHLPTHFHQVNDPDYFDNQCIIMMPITITLLLL